jgi:ssDNA-binding replication factor A large subunit
MLTLEETIELILKHRSDYERSDILEMVKEKREELGPEVVNDESAAMIVARELGVDLHRTTTQARTRIEDVSLSSRSVNLVAQVKYIGNMTTFSRKDGGEGRVASLELGDETGRIRLALWDEKTEILKEDALSVGCVVQIVKAYVREGLRNSLEMNLGKMGMIRILDDHEVDELGIDFGDDDGQVQYTSIRDLEEGMNSVSVKAKVRWVSDVSEFTRKDGTQGRVMSVFAADDSGSTRIVFWDERADDVNGIEKDEVIAVERGYTRLNSRNNEVELHTGRSSAVKRGLDDDIKVTESSAPRQESTPLGHKNITELKAGMWDVDVEGQVAMIHDVRTFQRKDGGEGKVQNLILVDKTGRIRTVFWDDDVDEISSAKEGDVVRINHAYVKEGFMQALEAVAGRNSEIILNPEDSDLISLDLSGVTEQATIAPSRVMISDIGEDIEGKTVEVYGIVVGIGQASPVYQACPECSKKLEQTDEGFFCRSCNTEVEEPDPRMFYKITIDDGTETIRATLFGEVAEKLLGVTAKQAQDMIVKTGNINEPIRRNSDKILGRYICVIGRINKFRDSIEISAAGFDFADPLKEIERKKASIKQEMA